MVYETKKFMVFAMISCFVYKINWGVRRNLDSLAFSWEQRKLGELGTITTGSTPSTSIPDYYSDDGIVWVTPTDICENITFESARKLSDLGQQVGRVVPKNTILVTCIASIGKNTMLGNTGSFNQQINGLTPNENECDPYFLLTESALWSAKMKSSAAAGTMQIVNRTEFSELKTWLPSLIEQQAISDFFRQLDHLITLHQRKHYLILEDIMLNNINKMDLFYDYYAQWITVYKEGAIRKVTMDKYLLTQSWIKQLAPELRVCELSRITYQKLLNDYAKSHERQTTMDFHHQLKGAVLDAVDEGLIERDPTRKAIIKGKKPRHKKIKYLNQFELHKLLSNLDLGQEINWDWFILLVAKTGMRFSEALAITPKDFDFSKQSLSINKTWDYKGEGGFMPTKNQSSIRKIQIDWQLIIQFSTLVKDLPEDEPIFVSGKVYNSTVNDILERHCKKAEIPVISIHGLRHTHASLLLFAGVSIASVAQRLGHSSMTTTQKTYLHIIQELENKDVDLVMRSLSSLN